MTKIMHASSLKEFNLLRMYMHWVKFVPASYISIINSNLPRPQKKKKKGYTFSNALGLIYYCRFRRGATSR